MKKSIQPNITAIMKKPIFSLILAACSFYFVHAQQLAFPGAEGYGKYSTGGRGGKVVEVTNLDDAGTGSLRWALDQYVDTIYVYRDATHPNEQITVYQPLTVVFKVSGLIKLKTDLKIKRDNLTIAGQTAPCDGICITSHSVLINGATGAQLFYWGPRRKNVIIRHLRFRPGVPLDDTGTPTSAFVTYGLDVENYENVIVDHCSMSWANEECLAIYDNKNTTVQWSVISEGLYNAYHIKGLRSYGGVWGGQYASYHHNLISNQNSRTPRFDGSRAHDTIALVDYNNNVNYNWGTSSAPYGGEVEIPGGLSRVNIMNNYYKPGPATPGTQKLVRPDYPSSSIAVARWHVEGNIIFGNATRTADNWQAVDFVNIPVASRDSARSDTAFTVAAPINMKTAQEAYDSVVAYSGAILPKRDAVDIRLMNEVVTKTAIGMGTFGKAGIIDSPDAVGGLPTYNNCNAAADTDHDGMPDYWELANSLNPNDPEDRNIVGSDGYTMLENFLNGITGNEPVPVKLSSFAASLNEATVKATLHWNTASEINLHQFIVEKSNNGREFTAIGNVAASGIVNGNNYSFEDKTPLTATAYYRLKTIDNDGTFSYSQIGIVKVNTKGLLQVYPNPVNNNITVIHKTANAGAVISILSADGRKIKDSKVGTGITSSMLNVQSLVSGNYMLIFDNGGEKSFVKFVKQ